MKTERISSKLWDDDAFTGLPDATQLLYLRIYLSGSLSHLGVTVAPLSLWAPLHRPQQSVTVEKRRQALLELDEAGFTPYDQGTDEILVIQYIRETGAWRSPKLVRVLPSAAAEIRSRKLRTILGAEILTLPVSELSSDPRPTNTASSQRNDCWTGLDSVYRVLTGNSLPPAETMTGNIDLLPSSTWTDLMALAEEWDTWKDLDAYAPESSRGVVLDLSAVRSN